MNERIAIVDDEPDIVELITLHLGKAGFRPEGYTGAAPFLHSIEEDPPDLIILDLMLPDADGFEICRRLKASPALAPVPVIMLTARTEETDRVLGLELGADDYVTKPFSPRELVARVKAVLRRGRRPEETERISVGDLLEIDPQRFAVRVEGEPVALTSTEFRILGLLASRRGWVFSRKQILDHLWGEEKIVVDRTVDVHIRNLRRKLGPAARYIRNVRGVGYKMEA
jgi:two-component system phosphate regulon response regulator PhoB/two-component system alkaline phosphatase synthesis response regulator PhoP